jgi:predicted phosphoribosyltransferase
VRSLGAERVIAAAPVATAAAISSLGDEVDEVVCVKCTPLPWRLRGWFDQPLPPLSDEPTA